MKRLEGKKELENMLFSDPAFIKNGGGAYVGHHFAKGSTIETLFSVYLLLSAEGRLSEENMRQYLLEMYKYGIHGHTYELHAVNSVRLWFEQKDGDAMCAWRRADTGEEELRYIVFIILKAFAKTSHLYKPTIRFFEEHLSVTDS